MENEILIALLSKMVDARIASLPIIPGGRGPRGRAGSPGADGKGFIFSEHESTIRAWAQEFAVKFEDFTTEQIEKIRGPRGSDGHNGRDAELDPDQMRAWAKEFALTFEDLNAEQIEEIRGPRGRDGRPGNDGSSFIFEENRADIESIIRSTVEGSYENLRLRFADLSADDIEQLRGPRGRDGNNGRDFIFDEHREFFNGLKLKFTDLTEEERQSLLLRFSHLSEEEKASLKLRFTDLTEDDKLTIRGPRGARGQKGRGEKGDKGDKGDPGLSIRGVPGVRGIRGLTGGRGNDGNDGQDAPYVVDIRIDQTKNEFSLIFEFSDGSVIETGRVEIPESKKLAFYHHGSSGAPGKSAYQIWLDLGNTGSEQDFIDSLGGGGVATPYETRIDEVSDTVTYIGKAIPGSDNDEAVWQIKKMVIDGNETSIEWADGEASFDKVWDDRTSLTYT